MKFSTMLNGAVSKGKKVTENMISKLDGAGDSLEKVGERVARKHELGEIKQAYATAAEEFAYMLVELGELPEGFSTKILDKYDELLALNFDIEKREAAEIKERGLLICPECGKTISKESKFCNKCGTRIFSHDEIVVAFTNDVGELTTRDVVLKDETVYKTVSLAPDFSKDDEILVVTNLKGKIIDIDIEDIKEII